MMTATGTMPLLVYKVHDNGKSDGNALDIVGGDDQPLALSDEADAIAHAIATSRAELRAELHTEIAQLTGQLQGLREGLARVDGQLSAITALLAVSAPRKAVGGEVIRKTRTMR
jgi:hypothetical protein